MPHQGLNPVFTHINFKNHLVPYSIYKVRWVLWNQESWNQARIIGAFTLDNHLISAIRNTWGCGCIMESPPLPLLLLKNNTDVIPIYPILCFPKCFHIFYFILFSQSWEEIIIFILNKKCISPRVNDKLVTERKPESRFLYFYPKTLSIKLHLNSNVLISLPYWIKIMIKQKFPKGICSVKSFSWLRSIGFRSPDYHQCQPDKTMCFGNTETFKKVPCRILII